MEPTGLTAATVRITCMGARETTLLFGGVGHDRLQGRRGADRVSGGNGNDRSRAVTAMTVSPAATAATGSSVAAGVDSYSCGAGEDTVRGPRLVELIRRSCEHIDFSFDSRERDDPHRSVPCSR